jgi:hypothetical protein
MAGLLEIFWNRPELQSARGHLYKLDLSKSDGSLLLLVLTISLLVFISSAYLVGFVFGALSYFVERIWGHTSPKNLHELLMSFGTSEGQEDQLREAFKDQFQFELDEADSKQGNGGNSKVVSSQRLTESSALCSYYVWANAPNLGTMTSRWDAETLASRSVFAASLILILLRLIQMATSYVRQSEVGSLASLIIFLSVGIAACVQYQFERRKQIQGRFSLFQALRATLRHKGVAIGSTAGPREGQVHKQLGAEREK